MNPDRVTVTQASCLQRWGTTPPQLIPPCTPAQTPRYTECPFPVNEDINNKICIWEGDIALLEADGIIAGTNEYTPPRRSLSERVFQRGRPRGDNSRGALDIGEVRVVEEPSVVARYLIYTVGPKFRPRYRTTCDHALHTAYRNVLDRARQLRLSSVGLGVVHSTRRNYPPNYGAHIGLRTLRRYLENYPDVFDVVVLVVDPFNHGLYERILPLYFPRSPIEEQAACWKLPAPIGGPWGEPIVEESEMRIIENPQNIFEDDDDEETVFASRQQISEHPFTRMESDLDTERLLGGRQVIYSTGDPVLDLIMKDFEEKGRYERMLRRARSEDLTEISKLGCIYQNGFDKLGRPVVIFVGKWFRARETNLNKFFLYVINFLDPIVNQDYVIIYFHTRTTQENRPRINWFTTVYNILPYKYKKNLKAVYIVHPSFWTKSLTWWFTKFMAPAIKKKIHTITGVEYLYSVVVPDQLEIPAFITEYDISINGVCYYKPQQPITSEEEETEPEPIPSTSGLRSSMSEPQPSTSGFGTSTWEPRPSTSGLHSATEEPGPSTSGLDSSDWEPRPSTSGLSTSTCEMHTSTSEVGTSTWELRPSPSGFRFSKLGPRSPTSQPEPDPWKLQPGPSTSKAGPLTSQSARKAREPQPGPSTSQIKPDASKLAQPGPSTSQVGPSTPQSAQKGREPQPGPSTSQVGPSTSQSARKAREPQPGPSTSQIKPDASKLQPGPSTSQSARKAREPQPGPSTSQIKPDPWLLQPGPSTSQVGLSTSQSEPMGWEPQPGPSTSQIRPDPWLLQPGPSTSQVGLSTSQSEPMGRKPQPGPSTSQIRPDPWKLQRRSSTSQSETTFISDPQPGPSTLEPTKETKPLSLETKPLPSETKPLPTKTQISKKRSAHKQAEFS